LDDQERSRRFLFDLDPPKSRRQRVISVFLWFAVVLILAIPLRMLLIDDGAASQAASAPVATGLAEMCSRFALPAVLEEFVGLAYPLWSNVCDLVGR
jgi:hypothetical protein